MPTLTKWPLLQRRAADDDDDDDDWNYVIDDDGVSWWYSDTGVIVKWVVFISISVIFLAWIVGGYLHAKSRLKKGLPLLAYHRCLVSRRTRAQYDPGYQYPQASYHQAGYHQPGYPMHPPPNGQQMYSMPPPVYDPDRPPVYEPPAGGTKVDPAQARRDPGDFEYQAPPGPPPAALPR
ncbi:hypothetical protein QQZ08_003204 [Neonectria magnoliae]|uniref:Uncharacterized protein n=1 Tax=Neonectria magnoliae TaxID=2732573 RepID=A0ABR1IAH1_9HYPO